MCSRVDNPLTMRRCELPPFLLLCLFGSMSLARIAVGLNCHSYEELDRAYLSCFYESTDAMRMQDLQELPSRYHELLLVSSQRFCRLGRPVLTSCFERAVSSCDNKATLEGILRKTIGICQGTLVARWVRLDMVRESKGARFPDPECMGVDIYEKTDACLAEANSYLEPLIPGLDADLSGVDSVMRGYGVVFARCTNATFAEDPVCRNRGAPLVENVLALLLPGKFGLHVDGEILDILFDRQ